MKKIRRNDDETQSGLHLGPRETCLLVATACVLILHLAGVNVLHLLEALRALCVALRGGG